MKKYLEAIQGEGYVAGEHGAARDFNPHSPGSAEYEAWDDGWCEADDDFRRATGTKSPTHGFFEGMCLLIFIVLLGSGLYVLFRFCIEMWRVHHG